MNSRTLPAPSEHPRTAALLASLDAFTRGYLLAALWTWDPRPGSGDYTETGLAQMRRVTAESLETAAHECRAFVARNAAALAIYGLHLSSENAGHDLWLTRNGHGTGYWDRAYGCGAPMDRACEELTKAACELGECYIMADGATEDCEDDGESPIRLSNEGEHALRAAGLHWRQTGGRDSL